jgi:hypothetical protein
MHMRDNQDQLGKSGVPAYPRVVLCLPAKGSSAGIALNAPDLAAVDPKPLVGTSTLPTPKKSVSVDCSRSQPG